jgi:hypothetical protein
MIILIEINLLSIYFDNDINNNTMFITLNTDYSND